ncbi:Lipopolysaccharide transport periplasmic protein LptA [uncultured Desulfobacterium sp.]|uniref:Lipopolysaccharide transport periplasmic protein LptA n=1 Tax=uncultured Desulfobacterium sp. TaxID=201089 RepID=A0A445MT83_9BACT|nr:Lipopolysaccharide transport periplasmic protein LptA [uncultured Desulfobacterium sp.]
MKAMRFYLLLFSVVINLSLLMPETVHPESPFDIQQKSEKQPIVIKSNTVEINNKLKVVTFSGDVTAKNNDFAIDCENMLIYYLNVPADQKTEEDKDSIDRIVATGRVIINRAKGGVATAEKATYFKEGEKLVLTGNPEVKQGDDLVKGEQITIFLKEDRSVVEGSQDNKVSVTIFPKREER